MFEQSTRYMTKGISERMPSEVVAAIWNSIDLQRQSQAEMDYLQVFKFENLKDSVLAIRHTQEQPERCSVVYLTYKKEYEKILNETVFVIDDGDHSTILFGYEY